MLVKFGLTHVIQALESFCQLFMDMGNLYGTPHFV